MDNQDTKTWEAYYKLPNAVANSEAETENKKADVKRIFEEGLECFSYYLCHANRDYAYNATYLPGFQEDFWKFIESFYKKYNIVKSLFEMAERYCDVTLKIDRYWMLETVKKGTDGRNIKSIRSTLSGPDLVCEKELTIECSVLYDMKRYVYQRKVEIILRNEELTKLREELRGFLKKYSSEIPEK